MQDWEHSLKEKGNKSKRPDFQGLLNNMQDSEHSLKEKGNKSKGPDAGKVDRNKGSTTAVGVNKKTNVVSEVSPTLHDGQHTRLRYSDAASQISNRFLNEEKTPDATSEKDLGNEYFKQKNFLEAIECYSRSIALSPTAVAFANRAMAYLKVKRFEQAECDCTEAINLDDRYVKAYSRRATARKELGKLKSSMEDAEFAVSLEPNNQELRKQYTEMRTLYEKEISLKTSSLAKPANQGIQEVGISDIWSMDAKRVSSLASGAQRPIVAAVQTRNMDKSEKNHGQPLISVKNADSRSNAVGNVSHKAESDKSEKNHGQPLISVKNVDSRSNADGNVSHKAESNQHSLDHKHETKASIQDLASRAASRIMATTSKNVQPPKTAYEFEVSWRALSDDCSLQTNLLKTIPPDTLPRIFKNALSAPMLVDIVKCTSTFFREDTEFALSILDNLAKVPRFDMIVMSLSAVDRSGLHRIWEEVLSSKDIRADYVERASRLRPKYCYGR